MNGRIMRAEQVNRLALPRIGKIKIGMKATNKYGKEYPTSVDYFIPSGKYAGLFTQAYGEKPNTIQIVFPDDDPMKVCNEHYEYRNDKGDLIATGDGEVFKVWNGREYAEFSVAEYPNIMDGVHVKNQSKSGWRVRLTMNFLIPLVRGVAGVWTFETNGEASSIPNLRDTFDAMMENRGSCKGVIFDLNVKFAQSQKPDNNSRYPVVSLVPNESADNLRKVMDARKPIMIEDDVR